MPIKIVVNGYYRSGTTWIWKVLKNELKEHLCFYEPLNPRLANIIQLERRFKSKFFLHSEFLLQEYINLDDSDLLKILRNHPNNNSVGFYGDAQLLKYFDIFNDMKENILLQANRLHFHVDLISDRYGPKLIHIIRNPVNIFLSIKKIKNSLRKNNETSFIKQIAINFTGFMILKNFFYINNEFRWINKYLGSTIDVNKKDKFFTREYYKRNYFAKFIFIWVLSNYYAIKSIERHNGYLLVYDHLRQNNSAALDKMFDYLGINNYSTVLYDEKEYKRTSQYNSKIEKVIQMFSIEEEFSYILKMTNMKL